MTEHTPGPWHASYGGETITVSAARVVVARLAGGFRPQIREANARLIAAAPELLAALDEFYNAISLGPLDAASQYGPDFDLDAHVQAKAEKARAALAKARPEGE